MMIVNEKPPIWDKLVAAGFAVAMGDGCIFTWGNTIYNPDDVNVDSALQAHEAVHAQQQFAMGGPDVWWEKWITDAAFRAEQEAQGYGAQYEHTCREHKDRNKRARYLHIISGHLASGMYKLTMSASDARAAILKRA